MLCPFQSVISLLNLQIRKPNDLDETHSMNAGNTTQTENTEITARTDPVYAPVRILSAPGSPFYISALIKPPPVAVLGTRPRTDPVTRNADQKGGEGSPSRRQSKPSGVYDAHRGVQEPYNAVGPQTCRSLYPTNVR